MSRRLGQGQESPPERTRIHTTPRYEVYWLRKKTFALTATAPTGYTVHSVLHGRAHLSVGGETFELQDGMTALLDPTRRYHLRSHPGTLELILLRLSPGLIADMAARLQLTRIGQEFTFREPIVSDPQLAALLRAIQQEIERQRVGQDVILDALMDQILVHLFRHHLLVRRNLDVEFSRFGFVDRRLRRAIEFIHTHFDAEVRLADMARAAFLSAFHFARLFKRLMGMTPHAYLMSVRLEQAARLLATTDLSILEIGQRVGYTSQSHFAKAFKAWTGLTPREYRQASRETSPLPDKFGPSTAEGL